MNLDISIFMGNLLQKRFRPNWGNNKTKLRCQLKQNHAQHWIAEIKTDILDCCGYPCIQYENFALKLGYCPVSAIRSETQPINKQSFSTTFKTTVFDQNNASLLPLLIYMTKMTAPFGYLEVKRIGKAMNSVKCITLLNTHDVCSSYVKFG